MDKEAILAELGLTKNEAKVYLTLLRLGPSTAGNVAETSKLHRTNVYDTFERLIYRGLVGHSQKNNKRLFEASDPNKLMFLLEERKRSLQDIMPMLLLDKQLAKKTTVEVYEGLNAFRTEFFRLLNYKKTILVYGIPKFVPELVKNFIGPFHKEREKFKIQMNHIYNEDAKERMKYLNSLPFTTAKCLPEKFDSPVGTIICGPEVWLVHWEEPITFVQIKSENLAKTYTNYFNLLYETAKSDI